MIADADIVFALWAAVSTAAMCYWYWQALTADQFIDHLMEKARQASDGWGEACRMGVMANILLEQEKERTGELEAELREALCQEKGLDPSASDASLTSLPFRYSCPRCGNKRCPHNQALRYACTGSNEVDQEPQLAMDELDRARSAALDIVRVLGPNVIKCCECEGAKYEMGEALRLAKTILVGERCSG